MGLPTPYFQTPDSRITIYHADWRDVLPRMNGGVDLVLSDPPYGVGYVTSWRSRTDPLRVPVENDGDLNEVRDVLPHLDRLLKPDRHAYLFAAPLRIGECLDAIREYWQIKNVVVWDKGDAGTVGDLEAGFAWNWEPLIYASKGRRLLRGTRPRAIYRYDWSGSRDPVHPTVKPVGLLSWLIQKSTERGEVVLDPFMGSGTTLRAAMDLGRRAIGIEIDERYCEVAARRLAQQVLPLEEVS